MAKENENEPAGRVTVCIDSQSHKAAQLAANLVDENLGDFLSKAADTRSIPILREHGLKIPKKSLASQGA